MPSTTPVIIYKRKAFVECPQGQNTGQKRAGAKIHIEYKDEMNKLVIPKMGDHWRISSPLSGNS
jgi:hypothetical protein